eukprot:gnl/Dysnectes_brevis/5051_a7096_417.p1 GENE.gnl/Dysnectes_brevis/5051_a7096_417~~gnl/Dysnectes_brevis/5051_a7096_417.p1  ORF type:complete len:445 (+),score=83.21 gnl/Dysnectes_brevis/5051_a7096_417:101-1435(+)
MNHDHHSGSNRLSRSLMTLHSTLTNFQSHSKTVSTSLFDNLSSSMHQHRPNVSVQREDYSDSIIAAIDDVNTQIHTAHLALESLLRDIRDIQPMGAFNYTDQPLPPQPRSSQSPHVDTERGRRSGSHMSSDRPAYKQPTRDTAVSVHTKYRADMMLQASYAGRLSPTMSDRTVESVFGNTPSPVPKRRSLSRPRRSKSTCSLAASSSGIRSIKPAETQLEEKKDLIQRIFQLYSRSASFGSLTLGSFKSIIRDARLSKLVNNAQAGLFFSRSRKMTISQFKSTLLRVAPKASSMERVIHALESCLADAELRNRSVSVPSPSLCGDARSVSVSVSKSLPARTKKALAALWRSISRGPLPGEGEGRRLEFDGILQLNRHLDLGLSRRRLFYLFGRATAAGGGTSGVTGSSYVEERGFRRLAEALASETFSGEDTAVEKLQHLLFTV